MIATKYATHLPPRAIDTGRMAENPFVTATVDSRAKSVLANLILGWNVQTRIDMYVNIRQLPMDRVEEFGFGWSCKGFFVVVESEWK